MAGMLQRLERDVRGIGALDDDLRRGIYRFVREAGRPVTREEVAAAVGISRKLAAFHLDKLLERELLVATYARPPGRTGRGAGRTAKYYEPSDREFDISVPERNYDVMGSILLGAIEQQEPGESNEGAAKRVAHETGEQIGRSERAKRRLPSPGPERTIAVATEVLESCGYEPYLEDRNLRMRNCPFHALAEQHRDIVCALNRELIDGVVEGLGNATVDVALTPTPGKCCVTIRPPRS
jgi:predicted ArsR family transcriptional regulator